MIVLSISEAIGITTKTRVMVYLFEHQTTPTQDHFSIWVLMVLPNLEATCEWISAVEH